MENISNPPSSQGHDLICPITLDVYRDPVLAEDGHVYERTAIIRWIEQQGTSPLTREPLDINNLRSEENIKQLCQSNSVAYLCKTGTVSISPSPITLPDAQTERRIPCKQYCNVKRTLLIVLVISFIISPFITATSVIFVLVRSNSISTISTSTKYHNNYMYPSTTYKLPNDCTLSKIVPLFSWNNVQPFNYTYYSKLYTATSSRTIITFAFRHDLFYWCLDNVSVIDIYSNLELMTNGHFENNPSDGFFRCNSFGNNSTKLILSSSYPYNGQCSFCDDTVGLPDYLSQKLDTKIGHLYRVSLWLQNLGDAPNSAQVVMSY